MQDYTFVVYYNDYITFIFTIFLIGPKTEPCGTPQDMLNQIVVKSFMIVYALGLKTE